ncbi:hypothetical protein I302_102853 [Kwoniella bestiolae CBS 10118]|uniref:Uncharacterized protein n=1 Tax=Kwoniella bestiolae CBS 10118 TaxID=1296100 RepID=A0A1B9GG43_9TREE|nr:hypothetical protein I302_01548 [Kwoniella bestiolae CBS 10118]OCF30030.1 hypothetical protein I302_01548 [Kwoniella bestiolae CBS 10118]
MGIFSRKSRQNTSSSLIAPSVDSNSIASSSNPNSPYISTSSTFHSHGRSTPSSLSPNLTTAGSPSLNAQVIKLRVAIDPMPFAGHNEDAKNVFCVTVSPDEGVAALRREIARTVGHGSMSLFKVSIPQQAFLQSKAYTERFGRPVHLLSQFPAFNLDDPTQLELSLGPNQNVVSGGELKIKHWFPDFLNGYNPLDIISIVARPVMGMPINHVPLTLRAYFAQPPQPSSSSSAGPSSSCLRSLPPPIVVDINPYITVDELKSELLRSAGKDGSLYKSVVLWQIAMTESEMNVIDELGRLKNGKMPWPYPPGAMEPIPMTDGNLPVSLFFPKSAPNGDMLNLSVWLNPSALTSNSSSSSSGSLAREIPHFRYPMTNLTRPASTHCVSPTTGHESLAPVTELPPSVYSAMSSATLKVKKSRVRPNTAPAATTPSASESGSVSTPTPGPGPAPRSFGAGSTKPPPASSIRTRTQTSTTNRTVSQTETQVPKGLGIVTTPLLDRTSFSSTVSTETDASVPSLNYSEVSLDTPTITNVKTPSDEKAEWLQPLSPRQDALGLKKSGSVSGKGSLRDRLRKVL